jgi:hypothetical protein
MWKEKYAIGVVITMVAMAAKKILSLNSSKECNP